MALISFDNETMKDRVLNENKHSFCERISAFFNDGKSANLTKEDLSWLG